MAAFATVCRLSVSLARCKVVPEAVRGFRTSTVRPAAQNFTMPALSPTMTEGSIATWNVKEGDSFAAGDVLLEIETDKATMDVEAQEDGVLMKIMKSNGSKSIQVGTRIAVIAEAGDDINALEIPPDESKPAPKEESKEPQDGSSERVKSQTAQDIPQKEEISPEMSSGKIHRQSYPLLPSVAQLVAENGLDESAVGQITPTGPNGRLLKGDVLAYLGKIKADTPGTISARLEILAHLDLTNIKIAPKSAPKQDKQIEPEMQAPQNLEVAVPVSFTKVIEVQKQIQSALGTFMPLSTFVARAAEVANDDLPRIPRNPTSAELFEQVLGTKFPSRGARGTYFPLINALAETSFAQQRRQPQDVYDSLLGAKAKPTPATAAIPAGLSTGTNIFSLVVPEAESRRASVFLERVKVILEQEPGRLVL